MAVTFGNSPATRDRDLIRTLIGDTTGKLSDEFIDYAISSEANVWYAAAMCADVIGGQTGTVTDMTVGDLSIRYGTGQTNYAALAKQFRVRGSMSAVPFAGGLTQSDKDTEKDNTDRVVPAFSIGMHDDPASETT